MNAPFGENQIGKGSLSVDSRRLSNSCGRSGHGLGAFVAFLWISPAFVGVMAVCESPARAENVMAQRCPTCARMNPAEAGYCYFDGVPLGGGHKSAARWNEFPTPFVFPAGTHCRSF